MKYLYQNNDGKEIYRSFNPNKRKIPSQIKIKGEVFERVWTVPYVVMELNKPKTLGALAEKNTREKISRGEIKEKKNKRPWWRKSDKVDLSLTKMSDSQKRRYIMTGKK